MKPIDEEMLNETESVAREGLKHIRALFAYEGSDQRYTVRAKVAMGIIGAYGRLRASETNRLAIELARERSSQQMLPEPEK